MENVELFEGRIKMKIKKKKKISRLNYSDTG